MSFEEIQYTYALPKNTDKTPPHSRPVFKLIERNLKKISINTDLDWAIIYSPIQYQIVTS